MAFDGITIASITKELNQNLTGGRIYKIAQPESDELLLTIKNNGSQYRLLLSADASLPLVYLTNKNKQSPMTAPGFCMLLRKHLQNARILDITQPGLERVIRIRLEHLNEMGDLCQKTLVIEIMGKHSNLIFCAGSSAGPGIFHSADTGQAESPRFYRRNRHVRLLWRTSVRHSSHQTGLCEQADFHAYALV